MQHRSFLKGYARINTNKMTLGVMRSTVLRILETSTQPEQQYFKIVNFFIK